MKIVSSPLTPVSSIPGWNCPDTDFNCIGRESPVWGTGTRPRRMEGLDARSMLPLRDLNKSNKRVWKDTRD